MGLHVFMTGRGARSPTLQKVFQNLVSQDFTMAMLHDDKENHMYVSPKMGGEAIIHFNSLTSYTALLFSQA